MEEQKNISLTFGIRKLELIEHSLSISRIPPDVKDKNNFSFTTTVGLNINPGRNEILVSVLSKFAYEEYKDIELGYISSSSTFFVENFNQFTVIKGDQVFINMPDFLMANFIGLAISSTRGMLVTLTKGTPLEPAILPLQDPMFFAHKLALKVDQLNPPPSIDQNKT